MAFIHLSVLAVGGLMMGIPILLHLLMKRQPKHQVFPAFRFLEQRHVTNKRQIQVRHWLLLALRMGAIGLLAAALARPSVVAAALGHWLRAIVLGTLAAITMAAALYCQFDRRGRPLFWFLALASCFLVAGVGYCSYQGWHSGSESFLGDASAPVAAVLVFDTSPRMGLKYQNRTRLDEARSLAKDLLKQLPADSEVAVVDASLPSSAFSMDRGHAANLMDSLRVLSYEHSLADLLLQGIELVRDRSDKRQEIYLFSELSSHVWQPTDYRRVVSELEKYPELALFVLDVGVTEPGNVRLGVPRLPHVLPEGDTLRIGVEVTSQLPNEQELTVEVLMEQPDPGRPVVVDGKLLLPEAIPRDRKLLKIAPGATSNVSFAMQGLAQGTHHGRVEWHGEDGLSVDNTRYFTVNVSPPFKVLLAVGEGGDVSYVENALSPFEEQKLGPTPFDCEVIRASELTGRKLQEFRVVGLFDPPPLPRADWENLQSYVEAGGSLFVGLGRNAAHGPGGIEGFNRDAGEILPGPLRMQWRTAAEDSLFLAPTETSHPVLEPFRTRESVVPWDEFPIARHWMLAQIPSGSAILVRYSNGQPALLEMVRGKGRILTLTTPLSDATNDSKRPAWNALPTGDAGWPIYWLTVQMFRHLAQGGTQVANLFTEETVTIPLPTSVDRTQIDQETWQHLTPTGDWQNVRPRDGSLELADSREAGTYRWRGPRTDDPWLGVSVNLPESTTDVTRMDPDRLDDVLGKGRYTLARGRHELDRGVGQSRVGRELFPFLMLVLVGVLLIEQTMADRFYGGTARSELSSRRPS